MATFFLRCEAKTRIRQHDWLKLAGEKIRCEQVGSVPTFLSVRANKFAKWKTGFTPCKGPIRLSKVHRKTGVEFVSNGIVGRNLGTKQKGDVPNSAPQYHCRQVRHQSFFELRKGELDYNDIWDFPHHAGE